MDRLLRLAQRILTQYRLSASHRTRSPDTTEHDIELGLQNQHTRSLTPAQDAVIATNELLESILCGLDMRTLLFAQAVCKEWKSLIATSPSLQRALFLQADPVTNDVPTLNPLLTSLRWGGSLLADSELGLLLQLSLHPSPTDGWHLLLRMNNQVWSSCSYRKALGKLSKSKASGMLLTQPPISMHLSWTDQATAELLAGERVSDLWRGLKLTRRISGAERLRVRRYVIMAMISFMMGVLIAFIIAAVRSIGNDAKDNKSK